MSNIIKSAELLINEFNENKNSNAHITEELSLPLANGGYQDIEVYDIDDEFKNAIQVLMDSGDEKLSKVAKRIADIILYDYNPLDVSVDESHVKMYALLKTLSLKHSA